MKVILGTYRGPAFVERALLSLSENLTGWDELTIVDDSGNSDWVDNYNNSMVTFEDNDSRIFPKVIALPGQGYNAAMQAVCAEAGDDRFMFWEEDFILKEPVDLDNLSELLDEHPELAQIALLRGPHFPIEHEHGGLLEGLQARLGKDVVDIQTYLSVEPGRSANGMTQLLAFAKIITQRGTFTCNPAVWQTGVAGLGWPRGKWSEDAKRDELLALGYRFGFLPGVKVEHDGERSGHGY